VSLEFRDVTVDYPSSIQPGAQLRALDHLNLSVATGESVAVIGPSGCGKSTMLRLATGLQLPTEGAVLAYGVPVEGPRRDTGLILQDFGLLPWADVYHNAELGLKVHKVPKAQREERTAKALAQVGLSGFERNYPSELSGGMQQRLALARAIAMDVDTLLMDEPLSALDALLREELQETLLELWRRDGYTQVLVTHSIEEAVFLGQRIVVMAPRPSRVVAVIDNPGMGESRYRSEDAFFARCKEVRAALAQGAAGKGAAR
jgi:NitT/TauT family transport system ATP-binding protein